jgi:hypothetical protein
MPRHLLLSAAAVGVMLASGLTYGQAPLERKDEPKKTEDSAKGGAQHGQERKERGHGAQEQMRNEGAQGVDREEAGREHHQAAEEKKPPASDENRSKAKEQKQEAREPSSEHNRAGERAKQDPESGKSSAETKPENSSGEKSRAEPDKSKSSTATGKSKSGTAADNDKNERSGTAVDQNGRDRKPRTGNSAEEQPSENEGNRPATDSDKNLKSSTDNQNGRSAPDARTNQANRTSNTQSNQQTHVSSEKQVRISETLSREHLAPPERDLNISIRVGEAVPSRVRLHPLPPEIVSIEPEYRDYEYFSTDDDIVIVEPGSHRIVSEVPRDPSRARAQLSGGGSAAAGGGTVTAGNGAADCKVVRRDASGNEAEVSTSTLGSDSRRDSLSVTIELPGGGSFGPIPLGAPAGDIVVATQGHGDCTVTLEPQTR